MTQPGNDIVQWADAAMYEAQPILKEEGARVKPRVFLLNATPDPLGSCAADMRMYRGDPVYSLDEITDEQRRWAWDELSKTHLNTPLEGVNLKFMIEAVTRSFTHQMVRQRVGAYYVQESLRFAVKRGLAKETALPPSISRTDEGPGKLWADTVAAVELAYNQLVDAGIPAEDARGLLPHAVTTRIIYHTNLRALFEHAGNRLCTQAQFEWRSVFIEIMRAMREYKGHMYEAYEPDFPEGDPLLGHKYMDAWQWRLIAAPKSHTFTPICYRLGKCAFMSMLDRGCTIRERVNEGRFNSIDPAEWMANPWAGITTDTNRPE
jgi:flavin-dependent thymidylate synthase